MTTLPTWDIPTIWQKDVARALNIPDEPIRNLALHAFFTCLTLGFGGYVNNSPKNAFSQPFRNAINIINLIKLLGLVIHWARRHNKIMAYQREAIAPFRAKLKNHEFTILNLYSFPLDFHFYFKTKFEVTNYSGAKSYFTSLTDHTREYSFTYVPFTKLMIRPDSSPLES